MAYFDSPPVYVEQVFDQQDGQTIYVFNIAYQQPADIFVDKWDEDNFIWIPYPDGWTLTNPQEITFDTAPDCKLRIRRNTDVTTLSATFQPGSGIRVQDLNSNFVELMFAVQEISANILDVNSDLGEIEVIIDNLPNVYLALDGSNKMLANLDVNNNRVINVPDPEAETDAANWRSVKAIANSGSGTNLVTEAPLVATRNELLQNITLTFAISTLTNTLN